MEDEGVRDVRRPTQRRAASPLLRWARMGGVRGDVRQSLGLTSLELKEKLRSVMDGGSEIMHAWTARKAEETSVPGERCAYMGRSQTVQERTRNP